MRVCFPYQLRNYLNQEDLYTSSAPALPNSFELPSANDHIRHPQQASQQLTHQHTCHHHIEDVDVVVVQDFTGGVLQFASRISDRDWAHHTVLHHNNSLHVPADVPADAKYLLSVSYPSCERQHAITLWRLRNAVLHHAKSHFENSVDGNEVA